MDQFLPLTEPYAPVYVKHQGPYCARCVCNRKLIRYLLCSCQAFDPFHVLALSPSCPAPPLLLSASHLLPDFICLVSFLFLPSCFSLVSRTSALSYNQKRFLLHAETLLTYSGDTNKSSRRLGQLCDKNSARTPCLRAGAGCWQKGSGSFSRRKLARACRMSSLVGVLPPTDSLFSRTSAPFTATCSCRGTTCTCCDETGPWGGALGR